MAGVEPAGSDLEDRRNLRSATSRMVGPTGLEPATSAFGGQRSSVELRAGEWWTRRESNSHFLVAGQAASRWLTSPWTTPAESNRLQQSLQLCASPSGSTWKVWSEQRELNPPIQAGNLALYRLSYARERNFYQQPALYVLFFVVLPAGVEPACPRS